MVSYSQDTVIKHYYFPQNPGIINFRGAELREAKFHVGTTPPNHDGVSKGYAFYHENDHILFIYNGSIWKAQTPTIEEFNWSGSSTITTNYTFVEGSTRLWLADTYKRPGVQFYETPNQTINFWNSNLVANGTPCAIEYYRAIII